MGAVDHDVIENTGRRQRRWPLLAVLIVLAVALLARFADEQVKRHETHLVALRAADAQATAKAARAVVLSTRQYTLPLLVTSSSATVRAGLAKLIDDEAARQAKKLQQARDAVRNTAILPWHHDLWDRKKATVSAIDAQIAALDAASHGADLAVLNALSTATPP